MTQAWTLTRPVLPGAAAKGTRASGRSFTWAARNLLPWLAAATAPTRTARRRAALFGVKPEVMTRSALSRVRTARSVINGNWAAAARATTLNTQREHIRACDPPGSVKVRKRSLSARSSDHRRGCLNRGSPASWLHEERGTSAAEDSSAAGSRNGGRGSGARAGNSGTVRAHDSRSRAESECVHSEVERSGSIAILSWCARAASFGPRLDEWVHSWVAKRTRQFGGAPLRYISFEFHSCQS